MNALVYSSSLAAAFLGGILALFAPCCVVSLLPNFVAASVQRGRRQLPVTTLLFSAGVATVLLPIVLGIAALGQVLSSYHGPIFVTVGAFLLVLGLLTLTGRTFMLPMPSLTAASGRGPGAVYVLGLLSGVASSCCAPVVMGVVAMSALAGSTLGGLGLGLAYVFGMVFPLFWAAILWERFHLAERMRLLRRLPVLEVAGERVTWNDVVAGAMLVLMGSVVFYLGVTGQSTFTPGFLASWDRWMTSFAAGLAGTLGLLPIWAQATAIALLAGATGFAAYRGIRGSRAVSGDGGEAVTVERRQVDASRR